MEKLKNPDYHCLPFEKIKKKVKVRKKACTNNEFGCIPEKRPLDVMIDYGIVNIDKPKGPTSHQVSAYVQKILGISKSGHSGTLDPKVTGVLPVALGNATRVVQALLISGKEYVGIMHLHRDVPLEKVRQVCEIFTGNIRQIPPLKSAVKRQQRTRKVYYLDILEKDGQDILFKVGCEAGTYIRKLCHDIGQRLIVGAHMAELRRTKAGPFTESTLCTLTDLKDSFVYWKENRDEKLLKSMIMPIETAVSHLSQVWVNDRAVDSICHGANLSLPGICKVNENIRKDEMVAVMTLKDELVCLGIAVKNSEEMMGEKGLGVKTDKVFMTPGTYPKYKP